MLSSWAIDRDIFNEEATKLRERFDAERGANPGRALRLLRVRFRLKKNFWFGSLTLIFMVIACVTLCVAEP